MKILYVYPESPLFPSWGIGTYLSYAAAAQAAAGHEIFLFAWTFEDFQPETLRYEPFSRENVRVLRVRGEEVWKRYPQGPWDIAFAHFIAPEMEKFISEVRPDVVESTDYQAPLHGVLSGRRAATNIGLHRPLFVTFCHGTINDKMISDAVFPSAARWDELVAERQALRWADARIVPSQHAARRFAGFGFDEIDVLREPYSFERAAQPIETTHRLVHLGHVSIGKGADLCVLFANLFDAEFGLEEIVFVGSTARTSFKIENMEGYLRSRLAAHLREKTTFTGRLPRDQAVSQVHAGDFGLNFRRTETFCYACIETIDQGALPMVFEDTALAEFFPSELKHALLPRGFGSPQQFSKILQDWRLNAKDYVTQIHEFNRDELAPAKFAACYERVVERAMRERLPRANGRSHAASSSARTARDVSILIPAKNPNRDLLDTLRSIAAQTDMPAEVVVCDDGSDKLEARDILAAAARVLPGVRVVRQANLGLLGARRRLVKECRTSLAVFLDADDLLAPSYVESTLRVMNYSEVRPHAVGTFRENFGDSDERVIRNHADDPMHFVKNDFRMTALIERDVLQALNFDPEMRHGEADDWDFWLRFRIAGYRFVLVPEFLFRYKFVIGSMSWPWSEGQTSLTAGLVGQRLLDASHAGVLTDSEVLLVQQIRAALEYVAVKYAATRGMEDLLSRPRDVLRLRRFLAARESGRWSGAILYRCFRAISGMARGFLR